MSKLTKQDIMRVWWKWNFSPQACYNYERMMGLGFLDAMAPALRRLYDEDLEARKAAFERHSEFFNCDPNFSHAIVGLSLAMEEQIAAGEDVDPDAVRSLKTGLMGPLSGIGDSLFQGVLCPIILSFAIGFAQTGNVAAPIVYTLVWIAILFSFSWFMFNLGYKKGKDAILAALENGTFSKIISGAGILGCMVLGALVSNFVSLKCGIVLPTGGEGFSLQTGFFDVLCPNILPLLLTLCCYKLLDKGVSTAKLMLILIVVGIVGALLTVFA